MNIKEYYEVKGEGPAMVFIHGSFASTSTWKKMVEKLQSQHKCILFKLPGHSGTPDPEDMAEPSLKTELDLLEKIIRLEAPNGVHLVGHSYGGVVALALALSQTSIKITSMTLYEPVATWVLHLVKQHELLGKVQDFLLDYQLARETDEPFAGGRVIDFWCDSPVFQEFPQAMQQQLMLLQDNNVRHWALCTAVSHQKEAFKQIKYPVSLVVGSKSNKVAYAVVDALYYLLPNVRKTVIEGAHHLLVTTHLDACLDAL